MAADRRWPPPDRADEAEIDAELGRDNTISGQENAAAARVALPTAEAKEAGWSAILDPATPNETARSMVLSIFRLGQDEVTAPYLEKYLDAVDTVMDPLGFHKASVMLEYGFPNPLASAELVARLDAWLDRAPRRPPAPCATCARVGPTRPAPSLPRSATAGADPRTAR